MNQIKITYLLVLIIAALTTTLLLADCDETCPKKRLVQGTQPCATGLMECGGQPKDQCNDNENNNFREVAMFPVADTTSTSLCQGTDEESAPCNRDVNCVWEGTATSGKCEIDAAIGAWRHAPKPREFECDP